MQKKKGAELPPSFLSPVKQMNACEAKVGPAGALGVMFKEMHCQEGRQSRPRCERQRSLMKVKDTDICLQRERKQFSQKTGIYFHAFQSVAPQTKKQWPIHWSCVGDTSPSRGGCQIVSAAGVVILPPGPKL